MATHSKYFLAASAAKGLLKQTRSRKMTFIQSARLDNSPRCSEAIPFYQHIGIFHARTPAQKYIF
jgi:hypothetical protein